MEAARRDERCAHSHGLNASSGRRGDLVHMWSSRHSSCPVPRVVSQLLCQMRKWQPSLTTCPATWSASWTRCAFIALSNHARGAVSAVRDRSLPRSGCVIFVFCQVIAKMDKDLDSLFPHIRTKETTMGNFVCDVARQKFGADVCVINSGTFRSDQIHPAGDFKLRDLTALFPFSDGQCLGRGLW